MSDELNQQIGRLEAHVEQLQRDMSEIKGNIKTMSDPMNVVVEKDRVLVTKGDNEMTTQR